MELSETTTPQNAHLQPAVSSHMNIKRTIGIMSSKGGVGKSFVTGLLARKLSALGFAVGILDADLTSSSIPMLFGLRGPVKTGPYSFIPLQSETGIKIISPDLLVEDGTGPFIWQSSLADKVIEELYKEVEWGNLDYLLIDLPPATSEVTISVLQSIPFTGVLIVTQPQEISTKITSRAIRIANKLNVSIIGIVENMSYYLRPNSNGRQFLFGPSHVESLAVNENIPVLARLPFSPQISELCDAGRIEAVSIPESLDLCEAFYASLVEIEAEKACRDEISIAQNEDMAHNGPDNQPPQTCEQQTTHAGNPFSDIVIRLIQNKDNMGVLEHPDAQGYFLGSCGDRMQIHLQITRGRILGARFMADGCGATLACGSMITKMACSKTIKDAEKITPQELISALDGLPEDHLHCAELAVMTLREAVIDAIEGHGKPKK